MKKVKVIYLYDGSFLNLLSLINYLLHEELIPQDIKINNYQANLFEKTINLKIKEDEKIITKIIKNFGIKIFNVMYYLYLSNDSRKELLIFYFWIYSVKYREKVFSLRKISWINEALKVIKYVNNENHKMKGFLRFQELQSKVLYAKMAPTNNILPLLVKHFEKRLPNEFWLIEDVSRELVAIYDKNKIILIPSKEIKITKIFSTEEETFAKMWQTFYQTIAIKSRKNNRCRMNFMPKKYWQYIVEVKEEL